MAVAAAGVERLLGRHDAARRRLERALEATAPGQPRARRGCWRTSPRPPTCAAQYAEMRGWAQQIERRDGVDGVVRAAYATLLAVGEAFAGQLEAADAAAAVALAAVEDAGDESSPRRRSSRCGLLGPARARAAAGGACGRRGASARPPAAPATALAAIPHDLAAIHALGLLGRVAEAEPLADETEQAARVSGNAQLVQWALWMNAWVLRSAGASTRRSPRRRRASTMAGELDRLRVGRRRPRRARRGARRARGARARARVARRPTTSTTAGSAAGRRCSSRATSRSATSPPPREHAERAAALAPGTGMAGAARRRRPRAGARRAGRGRRGAGGGARARGRRRGDGGGRRARGRARPARRRPGAPGDRPRRRRSRC